MYCRVIALGRGLPAPGCILLFLFLLAAPRLAGQTSDFAFYPESIPPMSPGAPLDEMFVGANPELRDVLEASQASGMLPPLYQRTQQGATIVTVRWEAQEEGQAIQERSARLVVGGAPEPTVPVLTIFAGCVLMFWRRRPAHAQGTTLDMRTVQPCRAQAQRRARLAALRPSAPTRAPLAGPANSRYYRRPWPSDETRAERVVLAG